MIIMIIMHDVDDDDDGDKTRYDICGIPPPLISPQFGWKQPIINCTHQPHFAQVIKIQNTNTNANRNTNTDAKTNTDTDEQHKYKN